MKEFIETLKADLQNAIEQQEQNQNEEYNRGREDALKYALEMFEKFIPKRLPKEIEEALEYIYQCERDMGFMGSPKYFEMKELVDNYNKTKNQ